MSRTGKVILALAVVIVLLAGGWWLLRQRSTTAPSRPANAAGVPERRLDDPALIEQGRYLAILGDCASCHTRRGGTPYAGGRRLPTPFGDVPAPNLTPDRETGLGDWTFEDFWRALHWGQGRDGRLLYPVFSYTSFTKVHRDDALALFAYLKSLPPVRQDNPTPALPFPYNMQASLAAWRSLYFQPGEFVPDPAKSAEWNRGAYLVEGLGHCNECHAPRDALGGTAKKPQLSGGQIPAQDWYAPDLSMQANGGLAGWSEQDVVDLLKTGHSARGTAFGPMAEVVTQSTQFATEADLRAMATYLKTLPPRRPSRASAEAGDDAEQVQAGAKIYADRCASCHGKDGQGVAGVYPPLDGNSAVDEPTGINAIRIVLLGGFAPTTAANPRPYSMPPFAQELDDHDVAAVVSYIRQSWSNHAGTVLERDVAKYRHTPVD
ncbi:c-type cytochrome [Aerosticca soli]|uniref:Putative diheme cytochrome c-553 n=1 Tax=Aerosticca soli TaxID=2010829 RepID=A0A2Z6E871_9GAMM|nr:cytochrome c [Aerosticca soli]BBD80639.1 putative diheme cytochrome c-553 [Aerosticca soli]